MKAARQFVVSLGLLAAAMTVAPEFLRAIVVKDQNGDDIEVPRIDPTKPCGDKAGPAGDVEECLDMEEGGPDHIDARADAKLEPETYNPRCNLTFKVVTRGGIFSNVFGWYNVTPDPNKPGKTIKPPQSDLHGFLDCNAEIGENKSLEIVDDPAYKGGDIGFFMATAMWGDCRTYFDENGNVIKAIPSQQIFYSEQSLNDDGLIHLLTWQSDAHADAFYFGWEDNPGKLDSWADYDDYLLKVSGIQCSGSGGECQVPGARGICAPGIMQCVKSELECVSINTARPKEACNGLDDNCNGSVDEGDNLCGASKMCDKGRCVQPCGQSAFSCGSTEVCKDGLCVDAQCVNKTCDAGSICRGGNCTAPCSGVQCPGGQVCRVGRCVDPCEGVTCDEDYVCDDGACRSHCACGGCAEGEACESSSGLCVDAGCEDKDCGANEHCADGTCQPRCDGASCPKGEACDETIGQCVPGCDILECTNPDTPKCVDGECRENCYGVTCPDGEVCVADKGGACEDACAVKVCPDPGEKCSNGACVDRCIGVRCADDAPCVNGACPTCEGITCPEGEVCDVGSCINPCEGKSCEGTMVCRLGECVDPCEGIECDAGRTCRAGFCEPTKQQEPPTDPQDPAADAGGLEDAGPDASGTAGRALSDGGDGCGCSIPGSTTSPAAAWWLLVAGGLVGASRRCRHRKRSSPAG